MAITYGESEYGRFLINDHAGSSVWTQGDDSEKTFVTAAEVREFFAPETVEYVHAQLPLSTGTFTDTENVTIVRASDGRVQGKRKAGGYERQYDYLIDLASGVTGESPGDLAFRGAGILRNGGRAFVQISTHNVLSVADVEYSPSLLFAFGHDGTLGMTSSDSTIIAVCANTIAANLGEQASGKANGIRVRQSKNHDDDFMVSAHTAALRIEATADAFEEAIKHLLDVEVTNRQFEAIVDQIAPVGVKGASKHTETRNENKRDKLNDLYFNDERVSSWTGSKFGVLQALNTYDLWERNTRGEITPELRMYDETLSGARADNEIATHKLVDKVLATV